MILNDRYCKICNTELSYVRYEYKDGTLIVKIYFYCIRCDKHVTIYVNHSTGFVTVYYEQY
jgi:hypothetical protein